MVGPAKIVATVLGSGYSPLAPGTAGSIFGCLIVILLSYFTTIQPITLGIVILITYTLGIWSIGILQNVWPHDDNRIVIDEALGIFISLLFLPYSHELLIWALIIFRIFDIFKPLGIKRLDNYNSIQSVMWDDILAGIYTNIILQIIFRWGMAMH